MTMARTRSALAGVCGLAISHDVRPRDHAALVFLAAVAFSGAQQFEAAFPSEFKAVQRLTRGHPALRERMEEFLVHVPEVDAPNFLGQLYQGLRRPLRRASTQAAASAGTYKDEHFLPVTQLLTDTYLARWLTVRALDGVDLANAVVMDPAVGGGIFLIESFRHVIDKSAPGNRREVARDLLEHRLRGYDLDPDMVAIARVSLWLAASQVDPACAPPAKIFKGGDPVAGSLDPRTSRRLLARERSDRLVILMNPPFLGRRWTTPSLRNYLRKHIPSSGNDMCAAFMVSFARSLQTGDRLGVVHQSSVVHLSSLKPARVELLSKVHVIDGVDLGSGAFKEVTGDKTRVSLTVFESGAQRGPWPAARLNLSDESYGEKQRLLERDNNGERLRRRSAPSLLNLAMRKAPRSYSDFARAMQGTSTGNNSLHVKYFWEVAADETDWKEASKGGGYCRWWGLRRYMVRWGHDGSALNGSPGAVVRNAARAESASLVWSDTGMFGVNARLAVPGSVFIAAGPGIAVHVGDARSHLGYLNSRFVTAMLRELNPKLTLAPGTVGKIPFPEEALADYELSMAVSSAIRLKQQQESRRPDCLDWSGPPRPTPCEFRDLIERELLSDLTVELQRLEVEAAIDDRVFELMGVSKNVRGQAVKVTNGNPVIRASLETPNLELLDRRYAALIADSLRVVGSRTSPRSEGPLESLSLATGLEPRQMIEHLRPLAGMQRTLARYESAILHELALDALGYTADRSWSQRRISLVDLIEQLRSAGVPEVLPFCGRAVSAWLTERLVPIHEKAFRGRPVLQVVGRAVILSRGFAPDV